MHLVEHETALAGTPSAFEIRWSSCACSETSDHAPGHLTLDAFTGDGFSQALAVPA